eukprot:274277-Pelagomonas_calceolata.AAC.1
MKPPGKRHRRVKEEGQGAKKHTRAEESRPGGVTTRIKAVIPSRFLNFESVHTQAKLGHSAQDASGKS